MIYFDNAATTPPAKEVLEAYAKAAQEFFGNPAGQSPASRAAENAIKTAAGTLGGYIGSNEHEIYFTSGGTESDNTAIFGAALGRPRMKHIIATSAEHDAVLKPLQNLAAKGYETELISPGETGVPDAEKIAAAVKENTGLVCVMAVNNETGAIAPLEAIGKAIKEKNPDTLFFSDAVQGFGKIPINVKKCNLDMLSISAHKLHGLKGAGALYISEKIWKENKSSRFSPLLLGGGQQRGLRSGTEDAAKAVALAKAAALAFAPENSDRVTQ
ncbi:MAG: aminotransferase class V-fold PLP-dependent enzyme, partial [Firmicutes bacterium]|nr:aminotransferase class V-fold PLP-dependent enzyme [Bacillota bacterium]